MKLKKFIALLLCLTLCLTAIPVGTVLAEPEATEPFRYVSIGDSTTNGYGEPSYYLDGEEVRGFLQVVPTAYPALIRDRLAALDPDTPVVLSQFAGSALRPDDLDAILDETHVNDHYTSRVFAGHNIGHDSSGEEWFKTWANLFDGVQVSDCAEGEKVLRERFCATISEADLITYYLGNNNFGTFITGALLSDRYGDTDTLQDLLTGLGISEDEINVAAVRATVMESLTAALSGENAAMLAQIDDSFGEYVDLFVQGYVGACVYFTKNIAAIRALNPDCDIVVCGLHSYLTGITATVGDTLIDIGGLYNAILELFNQYIALLCPLNDQYYYADLNAVSIETYADELYDRQIGSVMQDYLDDMIGSLAKGVMPDLAAAENKAIGAMLRRWADSGFTDQGNVNDYTLLAQLAESQDMVDDSTKNALRFMGMTTQQALKAAWLYHTGSDAFTSYLYGCLMNSPMPYLFVHLTDILVDEDTRPVSFATYKAAEPSVSGDTVSTMLLDALQSTAETLEGIRAYGHIQDTLVDCVDLSPLDIPTTLAALDGGFDMGAIGQEVLAATLGETTLSEGTRLLIKLYFLFIFPDGMGIAAHPNINGHAALADAIFSAYENRIDPASYMKSKNTVTAITLGDTLLSLMQPQETYSKLYGDASDYKSYMAMGGFETYGYGLFDEEPAVGFGLCNENAYPSLVKDAFGIEGDNFLPFASGYLRTADWLYLLDETKPFDAYTSAVVDPLVTAAYGSVAETRYLLSEAICQADAISVDFGGNGLIAYLSVIVQSLAEGETPPPMNWQTYAGLDVEALKETVKEVCEAGLTNATDEQLLTLIGTLKSVLFPNPANAEAQIDDQQLLLLLRKTGTFLDEHPEWMQVLREKTQTETDPAEDDGSAELAATLLEYTLYYYTTLSYSSTRLLDTILAINPNVSIIAIGSYNGIKDWYYQTDETILPVRLGAYANAFITLINQPLIDYAVSHSKRVCYLDATDTALLQDEIEEKPDGNLAEDPAIMQLTLIESGKYACPSKDGHAALAGKIVALLTADPPCPHEWDEGVDVPATCCSYGYRLYTCDLCGETKEVYGHTYGEHVFGEWETVTPATQSAPGSEHRFCTLCHQEETRDIPPLIYLVGDIDGNGAINDWDAVLLERYLAGWNVSALVLDEQAVFDIDGNHLVTDWDCVLFDRYLDGWEIVTCIGERVNIPEGD